MKWDRDMIKTFRNRLNLTQAQLAELMGTSQRLISYWETGKRNPSGISRKFLTFIAEKEGVDLEELKN